MSVLVLMEAVPLEKEMVEAVALEMEVALVQNVRSHHSACCNSHV